MKILLPIGLTLAFLLPANAQLAPANDAGITMGHLHFYVKDVEAHRKFWVQHFGAELVKREGVPGVKIPGTFLFFTQNDKASSSKTAIDHVGLRVRNMAEVLKSCRAAGVEIGQEFTDPEGLLNAYVTGPEGVKVGLQQDTSLTTIAAAQHIHYYLPTDPVELRDWYVKTFSLKVGKPLRNYSAEAPGMTLAFQKMDPPPATVATRGTVFDHIGFEVKNLEAFCKKLEASGVKLSLKYTKLPALGVAIAFVVDPAGVWIELTEGLDVYI